MKFFFFAKPNEPELIWGQTGRTTLAFFSVKFLTLCQVTQGDIHSHEIGNTTFQSIPRGRHDGKGLSFRAKFSLIYIFSQQKEHRL